MTKQIYVTPYDLATKQCTAPSSEVGRGAPLSCVDPFGGTEISRSDRLVLIDIGGQGLAFSDYVISAGVVPCS